MVTYIPAVSRIVVRPVRLETSEKITLVHYGFPKNTKTLEEITERLMKEEKWGIYAINPLVFSIINRSMRFYTSPIFSYPTFNINSEAWACFDNNNSSG